ncbi:PIR Superfamily Protein [Plasmodium ovale wallikeri]|uniref:PIR Superfamily Protein n=1 Tax=Plasmodium ovale wallikeri TaxID=864142 RepID=A0A1A9AI29_PLAOA|nr:PIR Superfamily Protein [Plasmodium ovale wallikeri]SBT57922.1 PIR Superfamily Protein [Plasmodium ovale wallikeri]
MKEESYDFFKYFEDYIKYEKSIQTEWNVPSYKNECMFNKRLYAQNLNDLEVICAKFKCFHNSLFYSFSSNNKHNEYTQYLNFWVNNQLKDNPAFSTTVNSFYRKLKDISFTFDTKNKLEGKIYDIDNEQFTNMKFLYDLYSNYSSIKRINDFPTSENNCLEYAQKCVKTYGDAIKKCPDYNTIFCKALKVFKEKYDGINKKEALKNCNVQELSPLPEYKAPTLDMRTSEGGELSSMEQSDQTEHPSNPYFSYVTGFTGSFIGIFFTFLILYKYTPLRSNLFHTIIKGKQMRTNLEEEYNQELLLDNSELEHHNSDNMSYNILYNST